MNALGRGLASLIPKRRIKAEEIIDRIDSMEEVDTPDELQQTKETAAPPVRQATLPKKQVLVKAEDDTFEVEAPPLPAKPLVTPIYFEPEPTPPAPKAHIPEPKVAEKEPEPVEEKEPSTPDDEPAMWDKHEEKIQHINIDDITVNPLQPRRVFNEIELAELASSIETHGILQPLVVRRLENNEYELIAGERRLRAAKQIGWDRVPAVVRTDVGSDRSRLELALLENIQRQDLNPVDEALAFKQLTEEYGMSQEEIAERLGKSRVAVTNTIRLLALPGEVQQGLIEGKITSGHARTILMIPDREKQIKFYHHIIQEGLTVRKAEVRARRIQRTFKDHNPTQLKSSRSLLARKYTVPLEQKYGFSAKIHFDEDINKFEIKFIAHSESELSELVNRLINEGNDQAQEELE